MNWDGDDNAVWTLGRAPATAIMLADDRGAWKLAAGPGLYDVIVGPGLVFGLIGVSDGSTMSPMMMSVRYFVTFGTIITAFRWNLRSE